MRAVAFAALLLMSGPVYAADKDTHRRHLETGLRDL